MKRKKKFGIVPDKILVNGIYYLPSLRSHEITVGPSMRYDKIFRVKDNSQSLENILVLMPYWEQDIIYLLNMVGDLSLDAPVLVKFHPSTDGRKYSAPYEGRIKIVDSDLYDLLEKAILVIGVSSGTLVEAASLGIPVICVDNKSVLVHDYLPPYGKGIIWDRAESPSEIVELVRKFSYSIAHDSLKIQSASEKFKEMFFCEPMEQTIVTAFDLDN